MAELTQSPSGEIPPAVDAESPAEGPADPLDNPQTDRAVDDIVAHERDPRLADQEAARERQAYAAPRRGFWRSVGHLFVLWLGRPKGRWATFLLLVGVVAMVVFVPDARYRVLNRAGARAGASVTVADAITQLPLKNVRVSIAGQSRQTGVDGTAHFTELRLGTAEVTIEQPGFATIHRQIVLGWGSNPLGTVALTATGSRYAIVVRDYLTDKPLEGVVATIGDAMALSDGQGKIELTLESPAALGVTALLSKDGYRSERVTLGRVGQAATARLLTARKAVFIDKTNGVYNLYKSDLDGTNRELLLPGTGNENGNVALAASPDGSHAALVSTRDNQHDAEGYLLSTLTLVDVARGTATTLGRADQIQLIDWAGSRLVFAQATSDTKVPAASRSTLVAYDYVANSRVQLAAAPRFGSVCSAWGAIYYVVAADPSNGSLQPGLYRIASDGSGRARVYDHEVWSVLRTDYATLALQTADGWATYDLQTGAVAAVEKPASYTSRLYRDNADHTRSLWVNQGALMLYDGATKQDSAIQNQGTAGYPVQWLGGEAAIFRVVTTNETADYVTALQPGAVAHKVADVANTYGFSSGQ